MGSVSPARIIALIVLLAATAFFVHGGLDKDSSQEVGRAPLREAFAMIEGWAPDGDQILDEQIINGLMLDDYLFRRYRRGPEKVNLYVGFYMTAKKVGAAHDPLVCFNGQGWRIGERAEGRFHLSNIPEHSLSYSIMTAERGVDREMIVYWFQANGTASATTLGQKIDMVRGRLGGLGGKNAFVRITTQIDDGKQDEAKKRISTFIESFYPQFLRFMAGK